MLDTTIAKPDLSGLPRQIITMRLFYFMAGIGISAWAIVVPFAKIRFSLDDGTLGLILMASGTGGVLAMPFTGPLIGRYGSRAVLLAAGILFGITLPLLSLAPSVLALTILLFIFGATFGAIDIAMNAQAVVIEARSGRLLMSGFHALYSIGSLTVALCTSLLLKAGLSNVICAGIFGVLIFAIITQARHLLPRHSDLPADGPAFALPNRATLILGLCCFACFLTEGAVTDWSTVFLRFSRGIDISSATFGYAGFSLMMAASRLLGDRTATCLGKAAVMRIGSIIAGCGLLISVLIRSGPIDVLGFAMVGIGTGNIAPLVFSAAARVPGLPANLSVPAVVSLGYLGFLAGPVVIGLVAHTTSLSVSLALDAAMMFLLALAARTVV
jgi:predicted MFS family arabinose efflux permease